LNRAQCDLSWSEHGSYSWQQQRKVVAQRHAALKWKQRNFLHKVSNYSATEHDLVAVEDLVELPGNLRNRASAVWRRVKQLLEDKCERKGTHFVGVDPEDAIKECASYGIKTNKPL